jgi:hypothetical protein
VAEVHFLLCLVSTNSSDEALVRIGEDGRKEAQLPAAWTTDKGGPLKVHHLLDLHV